jgi:hypothetical protein
VRTQKLAIPHEHHGRRQHQVLTVVVVHQIMNVVVKLVDILFRGDVVVVYEVLKIASDIFKNGLVLALVGR